MDMSGIKVDSAKVEAGDWIGEKHGTPIPEMGDLCLKVRGVNSADWRKLQSRLVMAVPKAKRQGGRIDPITMDEITSKCLVQVGVTDWANVRDGAEIPYSRDKATLYLTDPDYRAFRDAALWACTMVGEVAAEAVEADAKN